MLSMLRILYSKPTWLQCCCCCVGHKPRTVVIKGGAAQINVSNPHHYNNVALASFRNLPSCEPKTTNPGVQ